MALSFTDRKRVRKTFGRIAEVAQLPNLIEVQRESYAQFLQMNAKPDARENSGLETVFRGVFPITDFAETSRLEYVHYEFEEPKYDVDECRQRGMNFAAPLKVKPRLIVFEVDPETQAKSVKDIKEQDVYMGAMPLMTEHGTFIINALERALDDLGVERGPGALDLRPTDLASIARLAAERSAARFARKQQTLDLDIAGPLPIRGEQDVLVDLVHALLTNASKFAPEGSTIRMQAIPHDQDAVVRVIDRGVGLSAEDLAQVFDRYPWLGSQPTAGEGQSRSTLAGPAVGASARRPPGGA